MPRRRLDAELVRRGLAPDTRNARAAVEAGLVSVGGSPASKPATLVSPRDDLLVRSRVRRRFVSRGGGKLDAGLDRFGIDVGGRRALDAGSSTGGFTDCLLQRGAARVIAADVGYGQLAWELRTDDRVEVLERMNVRDLPASHLPYAPDLVVADLSFVSLRSCLPPLAEVATAEAPFVVLVKPQFEAPRDAVGAGGVVVDPGTWRSVLEQVASVLGGLHRGVRGVMPSPLRGPAGNVEFLMWAETGKAPAGDPVADAVEEARVTGGGR